MTLKELIEIAKNELKDLSTLDNPDFRIEQAIFNKDESEWEIVVSYLVENTNKRSSAFSTITSEFQFLRMYKKLKINSEKQITGFYIYNNKE